MLPQKPPDSRVNVSSGDTVQIGCIGCVVSSPDEPKVFINCTPESGEEPFFYQWFVQFNETDELLLEGEINAMLSVTEEGTYICQVNNTDNPFPAMSTTTIVGCELICLVQVQFKYLSSVIPHSYGSMMQNRLGEHSLMACFTSQNIPGSSILL